MSIAPYNTGYSYYQPSWGMPTNSGILNPQIAQQYQPQRQQNTYAPQTYIPSGLRGRTVNTPDEITPQEVPMDGGYSFFPLADGSAVYMKAWSQDGKINTFKYIPEAVELPVESTPDTTTQIMERLDRIEGMLKNREEKPIKKEEKND